MDKRHVVHTHGGLGRSLEEGDLLPLLGRGWTLRTWN